MGILRFLMDTKIDKGLSALIIGFVLLLFGLLTMFLMR